MVKDVDAAAADMFILKHWCLLQRRVVRKAACAFSWVGAVVGSLFLIDKVKGG
jgi:hypothetical protein